jgi:hypothetical protein
MGTDRPGRATRVHGFRRCFYIADNAVNAITFGMKFIITQFKTHIHKNQKTGCQTNRQSQNIYQGKDPVSPEIPERDFEIVL